MDNNLSSVHKMLFLNTLAFTICFSCWTSNGVLVTYLVDNNIFNWSVVETGWLLGITILIGSIMRLPLGILTDKYGGKPLFSTLLLLCSITLFLLYFADSYRVYFLLSALFGMAGTGFAVMNPETSFGYFMFIRILIGIGGRYFSSFIPSTSLFFPKKAAGTAIGIQAGVGNFGVSLVQLLSPMIIGLSMFSFLDDVQIVVETGKKIYLENIAFIYIIPLLIIRIWAWFSLKSIPVKASFKEQLHIFKDRHTLYCTMTFGIFAGFSAAFPLMIKNLYTSLKKSIDLLQFAFSGPLIGSASRVIFGKIADKTGGPILTHITGIALIILISRLILGGYLTPTSPDQFQGFLIIILVIFFFIGIGNTAAFKQFPTIFAESRRKAAGVIGFTSAIAVVGPFVFNVLITQSRAISGDARLFFWFLVLGCVMATAVNWYFYTRKGCERPC